MTKDKISAGSVVADGVKLSRRWQREVKNLHGNNTLTKNYVNLLSFLFRSRDREVFC